MPVSLIEAYAHGVAVIATAVGAVPEIVSDGVSGLLVPMQDPTALAVALARLVTNPDLRARIAAGGKAVFHDRLDIRYSAAQLVSIYTGLLTGERKSIRAG